MSVSALVVGTTEPAVGATGGVAAGGDGMMITESNDVSAVEPSATTAAATPTDDEKQNLADVINSIHKTLGIVDQLYHSVSSIDVASQLLLLQRL
ncbi:hypothetical protein BUALT_Bualt05G0090700 [Buddleja alternifolia]|uniref:Uncharacterized protein n=1 Tax=Buddleja alternifolia TaxID=168488 RepID=A0AAV6XHU1_9LAMI|nr:hypothetical protein BUALT_Bualt05G0090700 [Buddleja alternifolia]